MDFKTITNILFYNKKEQKNITDEQKILNFFIVNRYLGKKFPRQAQKFNKYNIDKASCMDVQFNFFKNDYRVPDQYWKGSTKLKTLPIKEANIVQEFYELKHKDMMYLCKHFSKDVQDEIKRIKEINKELGNV